MSDSFALGVLIGATLTGAACGALSVALLKSEQRRLRNQLLRTEDRLYAAWQTGWQIPTGEPEREEIPADEPLPDALEEWVSDFDEAGQAVWRAKARALFAGGKQSPDVVIRQLERQRGATPDPWPQS